jgi:hypothetical protein
MRGLGLACVIAMSCSRAPAPSPSVPTAASSTAVAIAPPSASPIVPAPATASAPVDASSLPLVLDDVVYDPDTGVRRRAARAGEPGWPKEPAPAAESIALGDGAVSLTDASGKVLWRTAAKGSLGSVRPPDRVLTTAHVVAVVDGRLAAFRRDDGAAAWTVGGPVDRLLGDGEMVLSTDCQSPSAPPPHRWLMARRARDGAEVWKVDLPKDVDPDGIEKFGAYYIVRMGKRAAFVTAQGKVAFELDEELVEVAPQGTGWLVVTSKRVARLDENGKAAWTLPAMRETFVAGAGVIPVPGGDLLIWSWGRISDSGVELLRLRPDDGQVVFRTHAEALGVGHSKYAHEAHVRIRGTKLDVVSVGSYGTFVEVRSLAKGTQLARWKPKESAP